MDQQLPALRRGRMARLQWDPWRELAALERQVNDAFKRSGVSHAPGFAPALDAFHRDNALWVRLEIPGVRPDDVDISVVDGTLVVRGERKQDFQEGSDSWVRRERFAGSFERH